MDQDSINIDNGENQANKRSWYTTRARGYSICVCLTLLDVDLVVGTSDR